MSLSSRCGCQIVGKGAVPWRARHGTACKLSWLSRAFARQSEGGRIVTGSDLAPGAELSVFGQPHAPSVCRAAAGAHVISVATGQFGRDGTTILLHLDLEATSRICFKNDTQAP